MTSRKALFSARLLMASALVLCIRPPDAGAQDATRFRTGAFAWTPVFTLREAGIDTNVFDERDNPKEDRVAVFAPSVKGLLELSHLTMGVGGDVEFVYFQRYTGERSINKRGDLRIDVPLSRVRPYAAASYVDTRERHNAEIDLRASREELGLDGGIRFQTTSRAAIELGARQQDIEYTPGDVFRGVDLAQRLNRRSTGAHARLRYDLTPLTQFIVDGEVLRDRFDFSRSRDTENLRVNGGLEFAPDAVIRGRATFGYHKMDARGADALSFDGFTSAVDLGYVLLGRTRFNGRYFRGTAYSFDSEPYYLQTTYGGEVQHNLLGPVDVIARANRDLLDYPGIPDRGIATRLDTVNRYGGGIAIRSTDRFTLSFNYEYSERLSDLDHERGYQRRRLYTTVNYGF